MSSKTWTLFVIVDSDPEWVEQTAEATELSGPRLRFGRTGMTVGIQLLRAAVWDRYRCLRILVAPTWMRWSFVELLQNRRTNLYRIK